MSDTNTIEIKNQSVEIEIKEITSGKSDHKGEPCPYLSDDVSFETIVELIGSESARKTLAGRINQVFQKTWFSDALQATPEHDRFDTFVRAVNTALNESVSLKVLEAEGQAIAMQMAELVGTMSAAFASGNQDEIQAIMAKQTTLAQKLAENNEAKAARRRS